MAHPTANPLAAPAARAAAAIRERPQGTRWLLDCDTDADGLCCAAVMAMALRGVGHRFTVRPSRDKDSAAYAALAGTPCDGYILLDKGTSHLAQLAGMAASTGRPVVVVDHHNVTGPPPASELLAHVNPRAVGLDGGRDASASTTALAVALELCGEKALAWAPQALAGAVGDWQHMGGWRGWNLEVLERARAAGHTRTVHLPRLVGLSLAEALARHEPPLPGLHGDMEACGRWLGARGIPVAADVEDLEPQERTRLVSGLALEHLAAGHGPEALQRITMPADYSVRLGASLRRIFRMVDACGREGDPATGVAYLMGDPLASRDAMRRFQAYRAALEGGLTALRAKPPEARAALQVAWTAQPAYTGMVAGLAVTHLLADRARPLCVLAKRPDGRVQVSTRGSNGQVAAGLDLGRAVLAAAQAVGSEGGGHPVAAGAVLDLGRVPEFLDLLDKSLAGQGFVERVRPEQMAGGF